MGLGLLILGIFPGPSCVDVVAKLGHVLSDGASANFHGNAGGCSKPVSPGPSIYMQTLFFQYRSWMKVHM